MTTPTRVTSSTNTTLPPRSSCSSTSSITSGFGLSPVPISSSNLVRYGVENWVPTYLTEVKGITLGSASASYLWYELAGIPGTLLAGWVSDHVFHGRRGPASFCYMVLVTVFLVVYMSANSLAVINAALVAIGFLIYGPVMLVGLQALDLVPKKAAGTAAGLTGLFDYFFGSFSANAVLGWVVDMAGWHMGFVLILLASIVACLIFLTTWNVRGQEAVK